MTNGLIFTLLACSSALLSLYYAFIMLASRRRADREQTQDDKDGVSVVVVSRNNLESLRSLIPSLLAQKHPKFEIVVVNDRSFDNTEVFLKSIQRNYPTVLYTATIPSDTSYPWAGKKFAVAMGVKAAHFDRMVLLDVHSAPAGENWLGTIVKSFHREETEFVIGYTALRAGGLRTAEEFVRQVDYLAWARAGMPFRAQSSNFAFRKSTFLSRNGYMKDMRVPWGEADFLLQDAANGSNTVIAVSRGAMVVDGSSLTGAQYRERDVASYAAYRHYSLSAKVKTLFAPILKVLFLALAVGGGVLLWDEWRYWVAVLIPIVLAGVAGGICARRFSYPGWMGMGLLLDVVLVPWSLFRTVRAALRLPRGWK